MSWTMFSKPKSARRNVRVMASVAAALTLTFGVVMPAGMPEVAGVVAEAQTTDIGVALTSGDQLTVTSGDTAKFEGKFASDAILSELEISADSASDLEFADGKYSLTINGKKIALREGDNLGVDVSSNPVKFSITGLNAKVADGTTFVFETPEISSGAIFSNTSVAASGEIAQTSGAPQPDNSESAKPSESSSAVEQEDASVAADSPDVPGVEAGEPPLEVSEPSLEDPVAAPRAAQPQRAPQRMAAPAAADGPYTFTIPQNTDYVLKGSRYIPNFNIPSDQLTNGSITLPAGTKVILKSNITSYLSTNQADLTIFYTDEGGKWREIAVPYKRISNTQYEVTLPQITIGGSTQIQFKGVHRGPANTVFSATFNLPSPPIVPKCENPTPETEVVRKLPPRQLTAEEFAYGSPVYVVTSTPKDLRRDTSILSRQIDQGKAYQEVGRSRWVYNSLAYDPNDNWLYAVSQVHGLEGNPCYPGGNLLQIDPRTGEVHNLGPITKPGTQVTAFETDGDRNVSNTGVWTENGYFVANTSTSGTRKLYRVNTDNSTAERVFGNQASYSEDWAVLPEAPRYMWGFQSKAKAGDRVILERIDTATGQISTWDLSNLTTLDGRKVEFSSASWGKAWTYANGNLGFGAGSQSAGQNGFELKIDNPSSSQPTFELVNILNNLPDSFNTDAASNLVAPPPEFQSNLAVKKLRSKTEIVNGVPRTFWTITVENTSDFPSSGGTFYEYLPTDTHYGVNAKEPTAKFEGFGPGSSLVNGRKPGPDQIGAGSGIFAGMNAAAPAGGEGKYMTGYVGTIPPHAKVEFVVSAPVRTDEHGNLKTVCSPNRVKLVATDSESGPGDADNVSTEACVDKVAVDTEPQPVPGTQNEFTARYNVVVEYPKTPGYESNEVVYGQLVDTPKFVGAAAVTGATVVFRDEFNRLSEPREFRGPGPYALNGNNTPKITKPEGVDGSTGKHVYEVTVRFTLDASKLDETSVPEGHPSEPSGNYRCYEENGLYEPNFGLMNEAEMGGWKDTDCIPLTPPEKKMGIFLEKVSYNPDAPDQIQTGGLLDGAEFAVHRADPNGALNLNSDGSVNLDTNPVVRQSQTNTAGRVELQGLDAPGVYYLIETKAPQGYNLLVEPIKFSTAWDEKGNAIIEVLSGGGVAVSGNQCDKTGIPECDSKVGILQIADVTKGEMPKTGGNGVALWAMAGAALAAAGVFAMRRRNA
ncbi:prealbumin-like fold domain-containing protein [Corynebacterium sp. HMSC064E08]|uniref:prealbumin-like fold domain-containing protein n=1 Tax=Corynebacterium sp. HMSC064E08 TaxID=1739324 RepID=UPI0008A653F3|nr:prealbumin-like fold domain-containing protein [Corynebacterium sp. HMSC064E08]OFK32090.1 cell surface protein [Corynebacterium sp. HMSC064E08]